MKLSDRAIADRADDILGRGGIAKTIYELIADTNTDSALRIGIYGGWGEGKTSVLRFVETLTVKANIPACWFSVWSAQTQPDLWAGLFDALQSLPQKSNRLGKLKAWTGKAAAKTDGIADLSKYTKAAHSLAKLAKLGPDDAKRAITGIGTSGRVVIRVDDVDRVDSALIPKLLMGLHDLFDELDRCAFVIALDPAVVSGGLSQINPAWSSAPAFLAEEWLTPQARERARIPGAVRFQEKWRLALRLLRQARASGVTLTAVLADAEFGDVTAFGRRCTASACPTRSGSRRT